MPVERHPRMIVSTEGAEGCGKTRFALSMPRPLTLLDFDCGLEGVEGDAPEVHKRYSLPPVFGDKDTAAQRQARAVLQQFIADFKAALGPHMRSLAVDTFTAAWAGQRLARADDRYVEYEEEFRGLIRAAYDNPHTNVVLIHHLRPDFKRDTGGKAYKAGTWSRDGMDGVANMVQLAVRQRFVPPQKAGELLVAPGGFEIDVLKARDNIGFVGQTFKNLDFPTLCGIVCPLVDWSK